MPPPPPPPPPAESEGRPLAAGDEEEEEEEEVNHDEGSPELTGTVTLGNNITIDRNSAAYVPRGGDDSEEEDDYGYTAQKIQRKYRWFRGALVYVCLNKGSSGLGISLSGHKDRAKMSVQVGNSTGF